MKAVINSIAFTGSRVIAGVAENPYRLEVLSWYRKCLKAAFTVPWDTDADAIYVLEESRRLFNQNMHLRDLEKINRKVREVEMRYALAVHYNIPYPRPYYKTQGSAQESTVTYSPYLDSYYDHPISPYTGYIQEGSTNGAVAGGGMSTDYYFEDVVGVADIAGRKNSFDTALEPTSTMKGSPE